MDFFEANDPVSQLPQSENLKQSTLDRLIYKFTLDSAVYHQSDFLLISVSDA